MTDKCVFFFGKRKSQKHTFNVVICFNSLTLSLFRFERRIRSYRIIYFISLSLLYFRHIRERAECCASAVLQCIQSTFAYMLKQKVYCLNAHGVHAQSAISVYCIYFIYIFKRNQSKVSTKMRCCKLKITCIHVNKSSICV